MNSKLCKKLRKAARAISSGGVQYVATHKKIVNVPTGLYDENGIERTMPVPYCTWVLSDECYKGQYRKLKREYSILRSNQ